VIPRSATGTIAHWDSASLDQVTANMKALPLL